MLLMLTGTCSLSLSLVIGHKFSWFGVSWLLMQQKHTIQRLPKHFLLRFLTSLLWKLIKHDHWLQPYCSSLSGILYFYHCELHLCRATLENQHSNNNQGGGSYLKPSDFMVSQPIGKLNYKKRKKIKIKNKTELLTSRILFVQFLLGGAICIQCVSECEAGSRWTQEWILCFQLSGGWTADKGRSLSVKHRRGEQVRTCGGPSEVKRSSARSLWITSDKTVYLQTSGTDSVLAVFSKSPP